jgi:hypothetical protein
MTGRPGACSWKCSRAGCELRVARLLPEHLALLEECRARVARANDYANTTARDAAKLASMLDPVPDERPGCCGR